MQPSSVWYVKSSTIMESLSVWYVEVYTQIKLRPVIFEGIHGDTPQPVWNLTASKQTLPLCDMWRCPHICNFCQCGICEGSHTDGVYVQVVYEYVSEQKWSESSPIPFSLFSYAVWFTTITLITIFTKRREKNKFRVIHVFVCFLTDGESGYTGMYAYVK